MRPSSRRQAFFFPLLFNLVVAHPYPRDDLQDAGFGYLMNRACASYCGADNQYCCSDGETCTTSSGIASCATGAAGGGVDYYTTTWTETRTYTSTVSSLLGPSTAAVGSGAPCVPNESMQEVACGPICCTNWQYCAHDGQCLPKSGVSSWTQWTTVGVVTTQFSAPYRVTSGSTIVQTPAPSTTTTGTAASETASSTSTGAPAPVASTSGSLSGGAIAGIVVGTIAGVILLLLLCFCCIVRGLWDVFAGIFGGGRKKTEREEIDIIEERYSRRGSRHGSAYGAARPVHRTWFGGGGGGGRPTSGASRKEKHSSSGGAGWLAAGLGAAALLLGLRREDKRRASSRRPARTELSSSYFTDSYSRSSPSEFIHPG
ncbi:hypothetical protein K449DRAFT_402331 [Hypoxylon sp. EC38]|nr:hypothetical protein K449DRAFT_402331 [Hypoxylon sp. EC38]